MFLRVMISRLYKILLIIFINNFIIYFIGGFHAKFSQLMLGVLGFMSPRGITMVVFSLLLFSLFPLQQFYRYRVLIEKFLRINQLSCVMKMAFHILINVFGLYEAPPLAEFGRVKRVVQPVLYDLNEVRAKSEATKRSAPRLFIFVIFIYSLLQ